MTLTDNKQFVDQNIWFPGADLETLSSAGVEFAASDDTSRPDMYIAYLQQFYRYCGKERGIQKLQPNQFINVTRSALKFSKNQGYRGNCLGADNLGPTGHGRIDIAGLEGGAFEGAEIEITGGTGMGQTAIITKTNEPIILDSGICTATNTNISISDSLKRLPINGYIGCQLTIFSNTGATQKRKILYNDANVLYAYDVNYQQLEVWNNNTFSAVAPYALPVATAGSASHYRIEKQTIELDKAWSVVPDATSSFVIKTGGVFNFGALATTPFSNNAYYDCVSDIFTIKTAMGGLLTAAIGTDYQLEKIWDAGVYVTTHAIASSTSRTIVFTADTTNFPSNNLYKNYGIKVTAPDGTVQRRRIIAQTSTQITVNKAWDTNPLATYTFEIVPDRESIYMVGGTFSSLFKYIYEPDFRTTSNMFDYGQCRNGAIAYGGQEAFGITTGVRNTGGITVLNPIPTVKGTGYAVGNIFNITTGGTVGKGRVETISPGGIVETVSLYSAGLTYTTGTGKATTNVSGTGSGLTVAIDTVGTVGRITAASNINLAKGDPITISGASESAWNTTYNILAIDSLTTFDIIITATANFAASNSNTTAQVVDATKNFVPGELKNKLIIVATAGYNGTYQVREITNNTATVITTISALGVAGVNGTSRYFIVDKKAFGKFQLYKDPNKKEYGFAIGGSTTTLQAPSNTNWNPNQWAGFKFRIPSGTGRDVGEITIISNTKDTLTYASQSFTPDATTEFEILDTYGTATGGSTTTLQDTTKNWPAGILQGLRVRYTSGTGQNVEQIITANTANTITFATGTAPGTDTTYTILASNSSAVTGRGLATEFVWDFFNNNGRYCIAFRGGNTAIIDRYDITTEMFEINKHTAYGQSETFTTGTQYVFDGRNRIYICPNGLQKIYYLDITKRKIVPFTYLDMSQGAAIIGNRMEILGGPQGEQMLVMNRQSTTDNRCILIPKYW